MRTLPAVPASVRAARFFAARVLADCSANVREVVELMVSELATNAVRHARTSFHLTIRCNTAEIRVEVTDYGGGTAAMRLAGPDALDGRGLQIVDTLCTDWGVKDESDAARTVWFTLALCEPPSAD